MFNCIRSVYTFYRDDQDKQISQNCLFYGGILPN